MKNLCFVFLFLFSPQALSIEDEVVVLVKEIECLTKNIFYEGRDQSYEGWLAIAEVTLVRKNHRKFPNSVCDVVYQPSRDKRRPKACQFSWTCAGVEDRVDLSNPIEQRAMDLIVLVASVVIIIDKLDLTVKSHVDGADYYVECSISQRKRGFWNRTQFIKKIGDHCFYKES